MASDYIVAGNIIVDPNGRAIAFNIDPVSGSTNTFERIHIFNNTIIRSSDNTLSAGNQDIFIGTGNTASVSTGNVFRDITIHSNSIWRDPSLSVTPGVCINANAGSAGGNVNFVFTRLSVVGNEIHGMGSEDGIDIRHAQDSVVRNNNIYNVNNGLAVANQVMNTVIKNNSVTSVAVLGYQLSGSSGSNIFAYNDLLGILPTTNYLVTTEASDQVINVLSGNLSVGTLEGTAAFHASAATIRIDTSFTPASGTASGNTGDIVWDSGYVYVCQSGDSWSRATLETF